MLWVVFDPRSTAKVKVRTVYIYRWTQLKYLVLFKGNGMHDWVSASDGVLDFILTPKTCDVFVSKIEDKRVVSGVATLQIHQKISKKNAGVRFL